jgi:hypothetical protein
MLFIQDSDDHVTSCCVPYSSLDPLPAARAPSSGISRITRQSKDMPRIELDTQFIDDVSSTTSSALCDRRKSHTQNVAATPGYFGLSNDFVVSSSFRQQVALQFGQMRYLPSSVKQDVSVERPSAYNPDYLCVGSGLNKLSWSTSSGASRGTCNGSVAWHGNVSSISNQSDKSTVDKWVTVKLQFGWFFIMRAEYYFVTRIEECHFIAASCVLFVPSFLWVYRYCCSVVLVFLLLIAVLLKRSTPGISGVDNQLNCW